MASERRYELIEKIGAGDFATTFSARDLKLDRKVAVKKLHEQYQGDDEKLARYWDEAQLLASLEHPNNMTIYDVVRAKGVLVLELMQGSLRQIYKDKPMPVQDVRQTLVQALKGLQCLHDNGIVHGDITPGNLFLSRQDVVKLGDFGLARRVNDDEGSLIKGTTRYIAPEIVSEEFGQVGPPSDLYSVGFSALDLMVGPEFESLFPDLIAFGRDRKMAWMMWHCSADRKFPPIETILEGVPDDLAAVLNKLTTKNQDERYQSAQQALDDLSANPVPVAQSLKDEAAAAAERERLQKKKRMRKVLALCCVSLLLSAGIIWFTREPPEPAERIVPDPIRGVVQNVLPIDEKLVLDLGTDWKEVSLRAGDIVKLNRLERQLRDLEVGDRVVVHTRLDPDNQSHYELVAFRPATHVGVLESVDSENAKLKFRVTEGVEAGKQFDLAVPSETPITLNTLATTEEQQPLTVTQLAAGDRVTIENSDAEEGMLALSIEAYRDTEVSGFIREIELGSRIVTIALTASEENADTYVSLPLHKDCTFTLNGLDALNERLIQLADLSPGDRVTLKHDAKAKSIDAWRIYDQGGSITNMDFESNRLTLDEKNAFAVDAKTEITLGQKKVKFEDLRANDQLSVFHDSPDQSVPVLDRITATRPADSRKWAILITNQIFEDENIPALEHAHENAARLRSSLINRYAIPEEQAIWFEDVERSRLQSEFPGLLSKIPQDAELYVYLSIRAYYDSIDENVFLASRDGVREDIKDSGLRLDWLLEQLDDCATSHKVLFVDCTHADTISESDQIAPDAMIEVLRASRRGGFPKSLFVYGSCQDPGESVSASAIDDPRLFVESLAAGFEGAADSTRDNRIEVTELAGYVNSRIQGPRAPVLILPNPAPPRISQTAKDGILELLANFGNRRIDVDQLTKQANSITRLTKGQPEPDLALGIVLLKAAKIDPGFEVIQEVRLKHPQYVIAHRCVAWVHFHKTRYDDGLRTLSEMFAQIPTPDVMEADEYDESTLAIFEWAGRLRELASSAEWSKRMPPANELADFDKLVSKYGEKPMEYHQAGRNHVKKVMADFAIKIKENPEDAFKQERLQNYVDRIADSDVVAKIKEWLDK